MQEYIYNVGTIPSSTAWNVIKTARMQNRPQSRDFINHLFDEFFEVHGDRFLSDDNSIITGIGKILGHSVTIIGQQKGYTIAEKKECNFGMPQPSGYRKSMRAIKQAEKFNRPIITFIDTPGAACGIDAEAQGQGSVIAQHLQMIAAAKVPVISILISEGGSGGALALALGDKLVMMENSYFSVISPEGCASILFKDASKASLAADSLSLTSKDLFEFGIADKIIKEKATYSIGDMDYNVYKLKMVIEEYIKELQEYSQDMLIEKRYDKYLKLKGFN